MTYEQQYDNRESHMTKIVFKREELINAIERCLGSIEKKSTMPILSHFLFDVAKGQCRIVSTNLDTSVFINLSMTTEGKTRMAVPARHLYEMCRGVRGEEVTFDYDEEHSLLTVISGRTTYTLPCGDVTEFPSVPYEAATGAPVPVKKLFSFFKKLQFSMTDPNYNKTYSGVLIIRVQEEKKEVIEMVTTDIHRISIVTLHDVSIPIKDLSEGIVVPGKSFAEMVKVFSDKEEATLSVKEGKLVVTADSMTFTCRLIKNEFPNYRNVTGSIAQIEQKDFALLQRKEIIDAVKRVTAISTEEKIWATRFEFHGDTLKLSASSEFGGSSSDEILIEKPFKNDRTIGLNARYFTDVANVLDGDAIKLIVEEGLRPLTIMEKQPEYTYTHMVMPLRI